MMEASNAESVVEILPALYVVATPIGNLSDLTVRAIQVLRGVDLIAAEDTRHSKKLLSHWNITTRLVALHEHNETLVAQRLANRIRQGESVALICDAGTPAISDPGARLVEETRNQGLAVRAVPGPCAAVAALSISGRFSDSWTFEGFLPTRPGPRAQRLASCRERPHTSVFYEAPHRILDTLEAINDQLGAEREIGLAKELTKIHETFRSGSAESLLQWLREEPRRQKGEYVVLIAGAGTPKVDSDLPEIRSVLSVLLAELPLRKSVAIATRLTGAPRNRVYRVALEIQGAEE